MPNVRVLPQTLFVPFLAVLRAHSRSFETRIFKEPTFINMTGLSIFGNPPRNHFHKHLFGCSHRVASLRDIVPEWVSILWDKSERKNHTYEGLFLKIKVVW